MITVVLCTIMKMPRNQRRGNVTGMVGIIGANMRLR